MSSRAPGAIYKESKYGAVLIDSGKCEGCRKCYDVCPYGALVFESDEAGGKAQKCTICIDHRPNPEDDTVDGENIMQQSWQRSL